MANNLSVTTGWDFHDKHIDQKIDSTKLTSANRTIIYAGPYNADTQGEQPPLKAIGVVQSFGHQEVRAMAKIFEIGSDIPYHVMGPSSGNLSIARVLVRGTDLVNNLMGLEAGSDGPWIASLSHVDRPCNICFVAFPNGTPNDEMNDTGAAAKFSRVFVECYIQSRSESISAGQLIIAENVSISYTRLAGGKNDQSSFKLEAAASA